MGVRAFGLYGENGIATTPRRYMLDASSTAGAAAVRSTATNSAGEVVNATTTGAADFLGMFVETVTYSATQSNFDGFPQGEEGTAMILVDPFAVWSLRAAGGSTVGTALNSTAPANILTNTTANTAGTTIKADEVGTVSMAGGLLIGKTGNNAGQRLRCDSHTNFTTAGTGTVTVERPFPFTIAVNDTFYRLPWSKAGQTVQFTSDLTEADATIVLGTGAPFAVFDVVLSTDMSEVYVQMIARDHQFNPLS